MKRILVGLNVPDPISDLRDYARLVGGSIAEEPVFADPTPPLAVVDAHNAELEAYHAQTFTRTRGFGGGAERPQGGRRPGSPPRAEFVQGVARPAAKTLASCDGE